MTDKKKREWEGLGWEGGERNANIIALPLIVSPTLPLFLCELLVSSRLINYWILSFCVIIWPKHGESLYYGNEEGSQNDRRP